MKKWLSGFTLIELLVVIAIIAILAGLLLPALARAREESRRKACNSNLGQISKACITYQEPNGDFFPAHDQRAGTLNILGADDSANLIGAMPARQQDASTPPNIWYQYYFRPMPSLANMFPTYTDNVRVFGCPSTSDRPIVVAATINGGRHVTFGDPNIVANHDPAAFAAGYVVGYDAAELNTDKKCSYMYDDRMHYRDVGAGQAVAADADGWTWNRMDGSRPLYPVPGDWTTNAPSWVRSPRQPNHTNGQNVMYFDGHVKYMETNYASDDPKDNIYCPNGGYLPGGQWTWDLTDSEPQIRQYNGGQWKRDTDAFLWDGAGSRVTFGGTRFVQPD